jgi:hypothetical protein
MKRTLVLITGILLGGMAFSQTVENIRVEPEGENIKISYRIGGSTESQLYNVFLSCSMDGGPRFEPGSVIGDVGQNIRGGRSYYTVIWDVFEDIEEVGNAEFFVRVEMISDAAVSTRNTDQDRSDEIKSQEPREEVREQNAAPFEPTFESGSKKHEASFARYLYIAYSGSQWNPYGFSFGTLRNWGFYGSIRLGQYEEDFGLLEGSVTAGLTKNIVNIDMYRLHGYVGAGIGDFFDTFDLEAGVSNILFNRLKLTVGIEYPGYYATIVYGIGLIF